jgi:uncharacterized protein
MKHAKILLIGVMVFGFVISLLSETPEEAGYRLMKRNDDQPQFQKIKGEAVLKIYGSTGELRFQKKLVMASYTENMASTAEKENYICYFMEPADDAGNSYLSYKFKNQPSIKYVYLKGIRKAKKVTGADKKLSFFGSDLSNGDIGRPDFTECKYRFLREEKIEFKNKTFDCYTVESTPRNDQILRDTGYGRKITYIEKKTCLTLRLDYFDENMIKIKEMRLISFISRKNVRNQNVYYVTGLEFRNVKKGTRSELLFKNMKFEEEANLNPNIFSVEYMTRKWW